MHCLSDSQSVSVTVCVPGSSNVQVYNVTRHQDSSLLSNFDSQSMYHSIFMLQPLSEASSSRSYMPIYISYIYISQVNKRITTLFQQVLFLANDWA